MVAITAALAHLFGRRPNKPAAQVAPIKAVPRAADKVTAPQTTQSMRPDISRQEAEAVERGREAARAHGAAIFSTPEAKTRPELAAHLAFASNLSTDEAVATLTLAANGGSRRGGLYERMSTVVIPNPGSETSAPSSPSNPQSMADAIVRAGAKARGEAQ